MLILVDSKEIIAPDKCFSDLKIDHISEATFILPTTTRMVTTTRLKQAINHA